MVDINDLLKECKIGLGISIESNAFDSLLMQKIKAFQMFMRNAGVAEANMNNDLAVGVIVMGVADLWNSSGGEVKFSPALQTLITQLAVS
jgi:hypothetical protein